MDCGPGVAIWRLKSLIIVSFLIYAASGFASARNCPACCSDPTDGHCDCLPSDSDCQWVTCGCYSVPTPPGGSGYCDKCCNVCKTNVRFVWPLPDITPAEGGQYSSCDENGAPEYDGHDGLDLFVADGNLVYAAFDGTVSEFNESFSEDGNPYWWHIGCAMELASAEKAPDGRPAKYAYYGYLDGASRIPDGIVSAGDPIAVAGGDQPNDYCRGDNIFGPMLYFEVRDQIGEQGDFTDYRYVDPWTCTPSTGKFRYKDAVTGESCVPNLYSQDGSAGTTCGIVKDINDQYKMADYSCGLNDTTKNWSYAELVVEADGRLNLTCNGTGRYRRCLSEVYSIVSDDSTLYDEGYLKPLIAGMPEGQEDFTPLNCFLRFVNLTTAGHKTCGKIVGVGPNTRVDWQAGNCSLITSLGTARQAEAKNKGYLSLMQIIAGESPSFLMHWWIVSGEYKVLGVDDQDNVEKMKFWVPLPSVGPKLWDPTKNATETHYILGRGIDLAGTVKISKLCKTEQITGVTGALTISQTKKYLDFVKASGFERCEYNLIDGGKFYDNPGNYIATYSISRLGANRGQLYYE